MVLAPEDQYSAVDSVNWLPIKVRTLPVSGPKSFRFAPGLIDELSALAPNIVFLHGLWQFPTVAVLKWHASSRKPFVVSPHGMLEPWSLQQSKLKKRLATMLYQGPCIRRASCIRATSLMEAESVRKAGYKNPIALIPNGVTVPKHLPSRRPNEGRRRALFLSRIHPKKGLLNLISAWAAIRPPDWELLIMGPDECGHLAEVRVAVRKASLDQSVVFLDEVWGDQRFQVYRDSDLFVLPSFSENFGLVIAEALACGVPVITTRRTPWEELLSMDCGWWIETGVAPLIEALREAMGCPPVRLREMGARGQQLVQAKYTWPPIAAKALELSEWLLGKRPIPEFVIPACG